MSILTWNDQLSVGIDNVDGEHQALVDSINRLEEAVALGADQRTIIDTIAELAAYTQDHFQHEEDLMAQAGYNPEYFSKHCQQHREFIEKIRQVERQAITDAGSISKDLLDFLVDWVCHHTLKSDKLMAISLNKGIDPAQIQLDRYQQMDILHSNLYSALRESEDRFKELADNLQALIWITNARHLPIFCNTFWYKTFGIQRGFVEKDQWLNTIHPEDREPVVDAYRKAAEELVRFKIQYRLNNPDGNTVWILETAVPRVRKDGKFAGLMGCGMDITSQKQAEAALAAVNQQLENRVSERTQALTAANLALQREKNQQVELNRQLQEAQSHLIQSEKMASLGQLAAGVAHEINNPLGYIYSNLHTLQQYVADLLQLADLAERLAASLPADHPLTMAFAGLKQSADLDFMKQDAAELVSESLEGATRAKKIVQDLRDFSRVDHQILEMFDLEAGMDATLNIASNEIKYKAEVVKEYSGVKPFECVGAQLNQVFMNLLVNAAQAIDNFGKITIRTGYRDADWVCVEIEDTGSGMDEATKAKIFDPFFTTKPIGKGTGLGLSLSYKIIQDHQGRLEVHSQPGVGTLFRILLPVHPLHKP